MSKKQDFIWAVRQTLLEQLEEKSILLETDEYEYKKYIIENMDDEKLYSIGMCYFSEGKITPSILKNTYKSLAKSAKKLKDEKLKLQHRQSEYKNTSVFNPFKTASKQALENQKGITKDLEKIRKQKGLQHINALKKYVEQGKQEAKLANQKIIQHDKSWYGKYENLKNYLSKPENQKKLFLHGGLAILGTVALGIAANYIYKRFLRSQASKACENKTGQEKIECIKNFKKKAIQETIKKLQSDSKLCSRVVDPQKCKERINKQIQKWQEKLAKI